MLRSVADVWIRGLLQDRVEAHELPAGERSVELLLFSGEADIPIDCRVAGNGPVQHLNRSARGADQTGDQIEDRRFAGAVRSEQRRDARSNARRSDRKRPPRLHTIWRRRAGR